MIDALDVRRARYLVISLRVCIDLLALFMYLRIALRFSRIFPHRGY